MEGQGGVAVWRPKGCCVGSPGGRGAGLVLLGVPGQPRGIEQGQGCGTGVEGGAGTW